MESSFRELVAWQQAMDLIDAIYDVTDQFPRSEDYALKSQMRRAAVSISSNIAEGSGRGSIKDFLNFLRIARGSARELETQLEVSRRVGFVSTNDEAAIQAQLLVVNKLLNALIASFNRRIESGAR